MPFRISFFLAGVIALVVATANPVGGRLLAETPEQKTEGALDEDTTFEFVDTPLKDVIEFLQDLHAVKIEFAPKTKEGAKPIDPDMPVTMILKQISLRSALHLLLDRHDLEVTVKPGGGVLLVPTTKELRANRVESAGQKLRHEKLRIKLLKEKGRAEFVNTPLKDIIAFLADQAECTIAFDHAALAAARVSPDEPISFSVQREAPLGSLLQYVLLPFDLHATPQDEVLLIVPRDKNIQTKPSPDVAKALATKLDIDLAQTLQVIAAHLTEKTGVPFILHHPAIKASGFDTDRAFVLKAQGVTPAEALKRIEPKLPLQLIERDGVVLVSIEPRK